MLRSHVLSNQYFHVLLLPLFLTLFLALLLASSQSFAASTPLYRVNVLVEDQTKSVRQKAFQRGLAEMFIRISGDGSVMDKLQQPESSSYVQRFSYEPLKKVVITTKGAVLSQRVKIHYNGHLIEEYLRDNGIPVWSERRSAVVVWLAVRDGKREYVLKKSDRSLIKTTLVKALTRRGLSVRWPVYDAEEKNIVNTADIRGGFKEPLLAASRKYSNGSVLSGSLNWNGKKWQSSWGLIMPGNNKNWNFSHESYKYLINQAVDNVADAMGAVFVMQNVSDNQQRSVIRVDVDAVNSITKYNRVENYLTRLSVVKAVNPMQTDGDKAMFEIVLRGSEDAFLSLIKNGDELLEIKVDKAEAGEKEVEINGLTLSNFSTVNEKIDNKINNKINNKARMPVVQTKTYQSNENYQVKIQEPISSSIPSPAGQVSETPVYYYRLVR